MADHDLSPLSSSRKDKSRSALFCLPHCCLNFQHPKRRMLLLRRSNSHLRDKYSNFISRIGRHTRRRSSDFHYDALSYAMNFEDDATADERLIDVDFRSFSERLPPSPQPSSSRELFAVG